ncbi:8-amino-7-oxononanoate synthase [Thalassoporum mexicanum PCC 7367]|uniref:8-amino-7-oxononanoate synthase n=1 Tax=Thalassoporum mexicanum TaxID=3457544 RepID=UPI00029FCAA0|nr:8-amino-7-oxononanoate synthase [Pseudanabaena sp. PCC 7367]AFY68764.1 8-amino-7-oxononanoate synthase [Pseudanabaena sp. PCC 7367]
MAEAYAWIEQSLNTIRRANWYRSPQLIASKAGAEVIINDRSVLMFASNNYLGLAGDQRLIDAAIAACQAYGTGATGSRLVSGHLPLHQELEQTIANLKQTEAALVFSSGYLANIGTIAALVGKRDLILGDVYNHSCLKNGAILSGATVLDYGHSDLADLGNKLAQQRSQFRRCLITTDSVFSMDGDLAPLTEIMALAEKYDCMVLVDEAHATGVFGDRGAGLVNALGIKQPLIQVGTLSKALGSLGGYVAGSAQLIDFLRNRAASWIYTTGLSPADTAAAIAAIKIINTEPERRHQLWQNLELLKKQLAQANIIAIATESPIVAIEVGDIATTLAIAAQLKEKGLFAPAIRPPTVPTPRIRLTLIATHTEAQINHLAGCLKQAVEKTKP